MKMSSLIAGHGSITTNSHLKQPLKNRSCNERQGNACKRSEKPDATFSEGTMEKRKLKPLKERSFNKAEGDTEPSYPFWFKLFIITLCLGLWIEKIEALGLPLTPEALATLPPFTSITFNAEESNGGTCKLEVAKTGLGSSAAMTTAVVAALLHYLGVVNLSTSSEDHHQSAHCIAQGKVGSGFDVSSAVYGSQRYVHFSPKVLSAAQDSVQGIPLEEVIGNILDGKWDHERTEFSLPPLMTLLLREPGTGGSSTPSMVGAVKNGRRLILKNPEKHGQS